ncbi:hypothetical protein IC575_004619 [Cucumis melo]
MPNGIFANISLFFFSIRFICEKEKEKKRGRGQPTVNTIRERENDGGGVFLFGVHGEARRRPSAITATGGDGVCWAVFGHQFFGVFGSRSTGSDGAFRRLLQR